MTILFETVKLKNQIIQLRKKRINVTKKKGSNHPETIKYSRDLNKLIDQFQSLTLN
jgi:hypothetical protein